MDELLNTDKIYTFPVEKYTADEFLVIFKERQKKLINDVDNIKTENIKQHFSNLFDDCPSCLMISTHGLEHMLNEKHPNWNIVGNNGERRIFTIPSTVLTEDEIKLYTEKLKKRIHNEL
jgi:hypothetical protein